jgi:surface polysaccharide O-acyltransferase-like enzyme
MIVGGTYDHLWFVPFALFGSVLIVGLQAKTRAWGAPGVVSAALVAGLSLAAVCAWTLATQPIDWPALQWLFALPSPLLGFALGRAVLVSDGKVLRRVALVMAALGLAALVGAHFAPEIEMLRRYLVSLALVTLAFIWPGDTDRFSQRLTPLLFGIYLVHPLLVRIYQAAHLPELPLIVLTALVFAAAALSVALLSRSRLRWLV